MRSFLSLLAVFLVLLGLVLRGGPSSAQNDADVAADFGEPIPGIDVVARFHFDLGREIFVKRFERAEGLGPHFNAVSCASCHEDPEPGGSSQRYRDFFLVGRPTEGGGLAKAYPDCSLENVGEQHDELCLPSLVIPHYGPYGDTSTPVAAHVEHAPIPDDAPVRALRNAPPLFGIGLFRLVTNEEILSRADPDDSDQDGISGRVNRIPTEDNAIGRFGYKCQTASIEAFNRGALQNQMGITSDSLALVADIHSPPPESSWRALFEPKTAWAQVAEPKDRIVDYDAVPDPEISRGELTNLIAFQENLAAPRRGIVTAAAIRGEAVFERIGCTGCHTPSLEIPAGLIHPYTDLLIHDMGPELADGVVMAGASGSEFRTQPLWGLCHHAPFLHDGRADTVAEAILLHGGEAQAARDAYASLNATDRANLHRFLESL